MNIIHSITNASQLLAARLYTRGTSRADRQRGISALEYIVLAVIIVLVVAAGALLLKPQITKTFQSIVTAVQGA